MTINFEVARIFQLDESSRQNAHRYNTKSLVLTVSSTDIHTELSDSEKNMIYRAGDIVDCRLEKLNDGIQTKCAVEELIP